MYNGIPKRTSQKPKVVRKLAPLASEEEKSTMQVADLTYDFAKRIIRLYQYLTETSSDKEFRMSDQCYRSGTSIGANVRESNHAQSASDFLSKMQIALKEADETDYWLNLLHDGGFITDEMAKSITYDCTRIIKILTSIVGTTAKNIKGKKQ